MKPQKMFKTIITLTLLIVLLISHIATASILQETSIIITIQKITSTTKITYTQEESKQLAENIDLQGDNNGYVNTWELLKYDTSQRRQTIKQEQYPARLEDTIIQSTSVDTATGPSALGVPNSTKEILRQIQITTTYAPQEKTLIQIQPANNKTRILVHENITVENTTPTVAIKKINNYQQIELHTTSKITLTLKMPGQQNNATTNTNTTNTNMQEQDKSEKHEEKNDNKTIFIVAILFTLLALLLILLNKKITPK